jgi:hypothetical protein
MMITIPAGRSQECPSALYDWLIANGVVVPQVSDEHPFMITDEYVSGMTVFASGFQVPVQIPMTDYLAGWLLEHFGETEASDVTSLDDMATLYQQLGEARQAERDAKARAEEARDQILARLRQQQAMIGTIDGRPAVQRKVVQSSRVDTTKLRREQPDIAAIYTTTSTSERLEIL